MLCLCLGVDGQLGVTFVLIRTFFTLIFSVLPF